MVRTQLTVQWFFPNGTWGQVSGFNQADTLKKARAAAKVHGKGYRMTRSIKMVTVPDRGTTKEVKV